MESSASKTQFGTIQGVLIPNITMMFGVILFLRLGVITASAGIWQMLLAIALSLVIMVLTSFSIGALATNMKVGDGGVYFIISRTLGIEVGGAIGIAIYFAQLISIALTVSGFSLSFCELFPQFSFTTVALVTLAVLGLLSGISAAWALQLQSIILALIVASIMSIFLGSADSVTPPTSTTPFYPMGQLKFWGCFAMFYPALTGIEAGMALSGSLRTPGKSLLYGNLYSLLFVAACYAALCIFSNSKVPFANLQADPFALVEYAKWPNLVRAGIWGATLSSALGCLLGAPRMLQSMAQDRIAPKIFSKVHGKQEEPRIALGVTMAATGAVILFTTIDQIIPMLAMICLVSYGLLNFVAAFSELMNIPSWRPSFRIPWYYSVTGVGLITITMFMISSGWTFITLAILIIMYFILRARSVKSGFLDLRDSFIFFISRIALYRLEENKDDHALTWHPQILALLPSPTQGEHLTHLTHSLTRRSGILTFVTVIPEDWGTQDRIQSTKNLLNGHFEQLNVACLSDVYPCDNTLEGYQQLVKAYGIGNIQPNTVTVEIQEKLIDENFLDLIDTCRVMQKNIVLLQDNGDTPSSYFTSRTGVKKKEIDIWWNPDETQAFDLVWSLVTTLTDGAVFRRAKITVKTWVADERAKQSIEKHLKSYVKKGRLGAEVKVFLKGSKIGASAPLTFTCLSALNAKPSEEEKECYLKHLQEEMQEVSTKGVTLFVTAYDNIDHRAIYQPKESKISEKKSEWIGSEKLTPGLNV